MLNVLTADESEAKVQKITDKRPEETRRIKAWLDERIAASRKVPSADVITLTPVLAQLLLDRNSVNRPITNHNSENLKSDVLNDRFLFNGESVVVSNTGVLLDGQHRALTVVTTGVPIQTVIAFGPKEDARFTIDVGRPKTAANFLAMKDYKYGSLLASTVRNVLIYRGKGNLIVGGHRSGGTPTKTEIVNAADQLNGIEKSVEAANAVPRALGAKSVLAFCHYVIRKKAPAEAVAYFFDRLASGDGLSRGNPILYCRNRLADVRASGGSGPNSVAELILKSWNAHRRNEAVSRLPLNGKLPKIEG